MNDLAVPMLTYALVMTFTPGPNNISAASLGMKSGYRASLAYLLGIATGFLAIMLGSGLLTDFLARNYARIAPWLRWMGAAYMIWLSISLFIEHPGPKKEGGRSKTDWLGGFLLQFVNPKGLLYGITIYSSFAALLTGTMTRTLASALFLTALGFASISAWSLAGSALSRFLSAGRTKFLFNLAMALLLLYSAISIILH